MFSFDDLWPSEVPIVVLDTETTGLIPEFGHRIVEIAAVRLEKWAIVAQLNQLVQPERRMDPAATAVNHISDADLASQPKFGAIAAEFLELIDGALLVAHNAEFDAAFLSNELFISGHATVTDPPQVPLPNPWLCTLQLARRNFNFDRNNLSHIAHKLNVRVGLTHRALNDVYLTVEVLKRMVRILSRQRINTVGDLLHAQGGPLYTPPPPRVHMPGLIQEALANRRLLKILYMGKSGETKRVITPRYATQYHGTPYLIAYCHMRQEQRTFRLDRIFSAESVSVSAYSQEEVGSPPH